MRISLSLAVSVLAALLGVGAARAADAPVYDIPRMDKVVSMATPPTGATAVSGSTPLRPRAAPSRPPRISTRV